MIPENETGVIILFAQQAGAAGFEIVKAQAAFPDAIVEKDGQTYRAEFEFMASNFGSHKHDPRKCDLIICWGNDCPDSVLPVLALSDDWQDTPLTLPTDIEREAAYWKQRALTAENQLNRTRADLKRAVALQGSNDHSGLLEDLGETTQKVLTLLIENSRVSRKEIAERLRVTPQSVGYHLGRLAKRGIIERNGKGIEVVVDLPKGWDGNGQG